MKFFLFVIFEFQTDEISDLRTYLLVKFSHGWEFRKLLQIFVVSEWFVPLSTYHLDRQFIHDILTQSINNQILSLTFYDIEDKISPFVLLFEIPLEPIVPLSTINGQFLSQFLQLILQFRFRAYPPKQPHQFVGVLLSIQQAEYFLRILDHNSIADNMLPL